MPLEDKVEYFGRIYELAFKTSRGSLYYFDRERRLWLRKKFDGTYERRCINLGCLVGYDSKRNPLEILFQVLNGEEINGFVPQFIVGKEVLGIGLGESEDSSLLKLVSIGVGKIKMRGFIDKDFCIHIGHSISEIYREVDPIREYNNN